MIVFSDAEAYRVQVRARVALLAEQFKSLFQNNGMSLHLNDPGYLLLDDLAPQCAICLQTYNKEDRFEAALKSCGHRGCLKEKFLMTNSFLKVY